MERFIIRKTTRNIKLKKEMENKIINKMEQEDVELDIEEYVSDEEEEAIIVYTDGGMFK